LFAAWVCWGVTLLAVPLSMWTGQMGLRAQIDHIDKGDFRQVRNNQGVGVITSSLNAIAIVGCSLGQLLLVWFALLNLSGRITTVIKENTSTTRVQEGQLGPQAPAATTKIVMPTETRGQMAPQVAPISVAPITQTGAGQVAPQAPPATTVPAGGGSKKD
jgi:hypothetical protein